MIKDGKVLEIGIRLAIKLSRKVEVGCNAPLLPKLCTSYFALCEVNGGSERSELIL